jgi:hypothetical protein
MPNEMLPNSEVMPMFWNKEFERQYGDLLVAALQEQYPKITKESSKIEKDFFYYKLRVLETLCDTTLTVPDPTEQMKTICNAEPIDEVEFEEFRTQADYLLANEPSVSRILTPEILAKCDEVITKIWLVSFYFDFRNPKPKNVN